MARLQDVNAIGTLAARPTPGVPGRYYFAEDESVMYRDNGVAWVSVASGTALPAGAAGDVLAYNDVSGEWEAATLDVQFVGGSNLVRFPTSGTATYTATSYFSSMAQFAPDKAADGVTSDGWAVDGGWAAGKYWQVAWSVAQSLTRVILRPRPSDNFGVGKLVFSDASEVSFPALTAGSVQTIEFARRSSTSLRVEMVSGGSGNAGIAEVEAYNIASVVTPVFA